MVFMLLVLYTSMMLSVGVGIYVLFCFSSVVSHLLLRVFSCVASAFLRIYSEVGLVACHWLMEVMIHTI